MARKISTTRTGNSGVLKDGLYQLVVLDVEEKVSSSGNDMIQLRFGVLRNGQPSGRAIWDNLIWSIDPHTGENKAQWKFDQFHDALSVEEGKEISCQWYKGKKVYASLVTDEYNGNVKNKVKDYIDPEVARDLLSKQASSSSEEDEDDNDLNSDFEEEAPPVQRAAARGRKRQQPVEMMEDEGMPI